MSCAYNSNNAANHCILELYHVLESVCAEMTTDAILQRIGIRINQVLTIAMTNLYTCLSDMIKICLVPCRLDEISTAFIQGDIVRIIFLVLALQSKISVSRDEKCVFVP